VSSDLLRRAEEVFLEALAVPGDQRDSWLASRHASEPDLLGEVRSLLESHQDSGEFLNPNELQDQVRPVGPATLQLHSRLGDYTILDVLGIGGMGVVYLARQERPRRTVALKVLSVAIATPSLVRRFEHEAEVLGRLQHPGIAQIYEAGVAPSPDGKRVQPFIAMELVDGPPLTKYADENQFAVRDRIALMVKVCDAVQHAHQRGVIHRDLKPANILVDTQGQPKVLDFGVARAADADAERTAQRTSVGQLIGTLSYMSPEQVSGDPTAVDTRTDVYALGVLLYEILAGKPPIAVKGRSIPEAVRAIAEDSPTKLGTLDRDLSGDLEAITGQALEKDKNRRYQSAAQLAEDLRRWLDGQPISVKQDSAFYVLLMQARRYRHFVVVIATTLVAIVAFAVFAAVQAERESTSRRNAEAALKDSEIQRRRADGAVEQYRHELDNSNIEQGKLLARQGNMQAGEQLVWTALAHAPTSARAHWALWEIYARQPCLLSVAAHSQGAGALAVADEGKVLGSASADGSVAFWDADTLKPLSRVPKAHTGRANDLAITRDGRLALSCGDDGRASLWDVKTGALVQDLTHRQAPILACALSQDGSTAAFGSSTADGIVEVVSCPSGERLFRWVGGHVSVRAVAFVPGTTLLVVGAWNGRLRLVDYTTGAEPVTFAGHAGAISDIDVSPDGQVCATGSTDQSIRLWNLKTGEELARFESGNGSTRRVAFSPDGKQLAASGWWRTEIWDLATKELLPDPISRIGSSAAVLFHPSGAMLYTTPGEGDIRLWEVTPRAPVLKVEAHKASCVGLAVGPRGIVYTGAADGEIAAWDSATWKELWRRRFGRTNLRAIAVSAQGNVLAACGSGFVAFLDATSGGLMSVLDEGRAQVNAVVLSPDGQTAYYASGDVGVRQWDVPRIRRKGWYEAPSGEMLGLTITQDGKRLIGSHRNAGMTVWNVETHDAVGKPEIGALCWRAVLSPDGKTLASGTWQQTIELFDGATFTHRATLTGYSQVIHTVAFNQTSTLLVSASNGGSLQLWDPVDAAALLTLREAKVRTSNATFLGADLLLAGQENGTLEVFDLAYFDRHIAGNVRWWLDHNATDTTPEQRDALLQMERDISSRPWPRLAPSQAPASGLPEAPKGT
jgi:WD40 repeat protein/predicted Ser/Thr protein kinase